MAHIINKDFTKLQLIVTTICPGQGYTCQNIVNSKGFIDGINEPIHQPMFQQQPNNHVIFWEIVCTHISRYWKEKRIHTNFGLHSKNIIEHRAIIFLEAWRKWSPLRLMNYKFSQNSILQCPKFVANFSFVIKL